MTLILVNPVTSRCADEKRLAHAADAGVALDIAEREIVSAAATFSQMGVELHARSSPDRREWR